MNKVILIGRLTRDSDVRYTQSNSMILKNSIAVNRKFKQDGQQSVDFINIIAFGKIAEAISTCFSKGSRIGVIGRIQTGSYDNSDGKKVYTTDIVVDEIEFIDAKKETNNKEPSSNEASNTNEGYFPMEDDEEIPF